MSTPKFADVYNLVAFLSKPTESNGFKKIIDFLNANPIKYALTAHIHAKVDGKKDIISEATIKRDLNFEDEGGVDCLSNEVIFEQLSLMGKSKNKDTQETQPSDPKDEALNVENVHAQSNDPPLSRVNTLGSREDRLKLNELMELCTKFLGEEDVSKQGRNIAAIDADAEITLVDETTEDQGRYDDQKMFDTSVLDDQEEVLFKEAQDVQNVVEKIKKSKPKGETTTTTTVTIPTPDSTRPKARGIIMQEPNKTLTTTIPISLKVQDKGKGIMVEEPLKMKKKDQINFDEQEARSLQVEIDEQDRLAEEKAQLIKDENLAWDNVQAMMDADCSTMSSAPQHTPIIQPSTSKPQKKQNLRKSKNKDTQETQPSDPKDEALNVENVPAQSNDPPLSRVNTLRSGEDRLKLNELMELCTKLVESSANEQSLGEEDVSKQGRNIAAIDADAEITLVDETIEDQGRYDDQEMLDTSVLDDQEEVLLKEAQDVQNVVEKIKKSKPKGETTTTTTVIIPTPDSTRPKAREPLKMKKKDQVSFDKQEARSLRAEIDEQDRLAEEKAQLIEDENLAWDNVQAMMDADLKDKAVLTQESSSKRAGEKLDQERSKKQKEEDDKESEELKRCLEIIPNNEDDVTIDVTPLSIKTPIIDYKI
nr:hypothetical protein [Tanacetum cinerariifolium]